MMDALVADARHASIDEELDQKLPLAQPQFFLTYWVIKCLKWDRNGSLPWSSFECYMSTGKASHGSCGSWFVSTTFLDTQACLVALMDVLMNRLGQLLVKEDHRTPFICSHDIHKTKISASPPTLMQKHFGSHCHNESHNNGVAANQVQ
ncbi:hypothetical protein VNO77_38889 [Canavalia gladiata]|uniref:Uncharacterized protein n=1 Tax=Canavalia gladiata TaxID=3824 RepID=A0AAN9KBP0_CANGL